MEREHRGGHVGYWKERWSLPEGKWKRHSRQRTMFEGGRGGEVSTSHWGRCRRPGRVGSSRRGSVWKALLELRIELRRCWEPLKDSKQKTHTHLCRNPQESVGGLVSKAETCRGRHRKVLDYEGWFQTVEPMGIRADGLSIWRGRKPPDRSLSLTSGKHLCGCQSSYLTNTCHAG